MKKIVGVLVFGAMLTACQATAQKPAQASQPGATEGLAAKMKKVEQEAAPQYAAFEKVYNQYVKKYESEGAEKAKAMEPELEQLYARFNAVRDSLMAVYVYGTPFTDLEMDDMDGKSVKLSQWAGKGNYVLIDFWASWCGPCRQEMPNVVANYAKYHSKGFEIVGVSFDSKGDAWKKAVADLGMKWPQMSDLKGWQSAGAQAYGISSIPASVLLDPQGKICGMNLRGEMLGEKLKEIYGE